MGDVGSTSAFYAARPRLSIDGRDNDDLSEGILALLVEETTDGLFRSEITVGNWGSTDSGIGYLYFDRQLLDFGKRLSVNVGQDETESEIFNGRITGLEARYLLARPSELVVLAEDRFQDLRMTRRTRTFDDLSDRDVMQQIASQHGLRTDLDVDGPSHRVLAQVNQSDLAFLRERAQAIDAEVWVEDTILHAQARGRRNAGRVTLTYGQGLREFSVLADLANQRTDLSVSGWDVSAKESIDFEATDAAIRPELNGFLSGSSLLQQAFGTRPEQIVHMVPLTNDEARALAEAQFRRMARQFVSGRGVAEGDGRLRAGAHVTLKELGPLFDGDYVVTAARHTFDMANGYRTHFTVERPGLGRG